MANGSSTSHALTGWTGRTLDFLFGRDIEQTITLRDVDDRYAEERNMVFPELTTRETVLT